MKLAVNLSIPSVALLGGASKPRWFIDPTVGSDSNPGSLLLPFATVAKGLAVAALAVMAAGGIVSGKCGTVSRESGLSFGASNITLNSYGFGAPFQIFGSTQVASSWTLVSGTEYSTPLAYTPRTAFWVVGTTVTKLRPGAAGSLAANQFVVSAGTLHVNIGQTPTGQRIEIAANNSNIGITAQNVSGTSIDGVTVMFMPMSGMLFNNTPSSLVQNSAISWNGDDGIDIVSSLANVIIQLNAIQGNGYQTKGAGGGPGDAISAHGGAIVGIFGNFITDNDQTAVGNENQTNVDAAFNYSRNNYNHFYIYNSGVSTVGNHRWRTNIIVVTATDNGAIFVNGPADATSLNTITEIDNNTIHSENASLFLLATFAAGTNRVRNNIFNGATFGLANYNGLGGNVALVDADFNTYAAMSGGGGPGNAGSRYQSGFAPDTVGANDLAVVSAGFTDLTVGAENFQLLTTSPAKASGTNLGYTRDQVGAAVPFVPGAPCRGALERLAA